MADSNGDGLQSDLLAAGQGVSESGTAGASTVLPTVFLRDGVTQPMAAASVVGSLEPDALAPAGESYGKMNHVLLRFRDPEVERQFNNLRGEQMKGSYAVALFVFMCLSIGTVVQAALLRFWWGVVNYSIIGIFVLSSFFLLYIRKSVFFIQYVRVLFTICFVIMMSDACEYVILHVDNPEYSAVLSSCGVVFAFSALGLPWLVCILLGVMGSIAVSIGTARGHTMEGGGYWIYFMYIFAILLSYSGERNSRRVFVALKLAERAKLGDQRMKYVATTSHDLRTPLNAFQLGLDMLAEGSLGESERRNVISVMQEATGIMCNTIDNLLLFSRSVTQGPPEKARMEVVNVVELFKACRVICLSYASGLPNNHGEVDIELELSPTLPQWVLTDCAKLQQMTLNLLTNARKFTQSRILLRVFPVPVHLFQSPNSAPGSVDNPAYGQRPWTPKPPSPGGPQALFGGAVNQGRLESGSSRARSLAALESSMSTTHPMIRVEVWDDGPGILPAQKRRLFKAFEQLSEDIGQGTGLGLFSLKMQCQALGGTFGVVDNPEASGGSIFFFEIPLLAADPPTTPRTARRQSLLALLDPSRLPISESLQRSTSGEKSIIVAALNSLSRTSSGGGGMASVAPEPSPADSCYLDGTSINVTGPGVLFPESQQGPFASSTPLHGPHIPLVRQRSLTSEKDKQQVLLSRLFGHERIPNSSLRSNSPPPPSTNNWTREPSLKLDIKVDPETDLKAADSPASDSDWSFISRPDLNLGQAKNFPLLPISCSLTAGEKPSRHPGAGLSRMGSGGIPFLDPESAQSSHALTPVGSNLPPVKNSVQTHLFSSENKIVKEGEDNKEWKMSVYELSKRDPASSEAQNSELGGLARARVETKSNAQDQSRPSSCEDLLTLRQKAVSGLPPRERRSEDSGSAGFEGIPPLSPQNGSETAQKLKPLRGEGKREKGGTLEDANSGSGSGSGSGEPDLLRQSSEEEHKQLLYLGERAGLLRKDSSGDTKKLEALAAGIASRTSLLKRGAEVRRMVGGGAEERSGGVEMAGGSEEGGEQKRVLVADDVALTQVLMKKMLTRAGYNVDIAGNGAEALESMKVKKYALVLMDIMMPVMDGYEAVRLYRGWEVKERPGYHQKICALTANAPDFERTEARTREVGMDMYMSKPFKKDALMQILERCNSS